MTTIKKKSKKLGRPRVYSDGGTMIYFRLRTKGMGRALRKIAKSKDMTVSAYVRALVEDEMSQLSGRHPAKISG